MKMEELLKLDIALIDKTLSDLISSSMRWWIGSTTFLLIGLASFIYYHEEFQTSFDESTKLIIIILSALYITIHFTYIILCIWRARLLVAERQRIIDHIDLENYSSKSGNIAFGFYTHAMMHGFLAFFLISLLTIFIVIKFS